MMNIKELDPNDRNDDALELEERELKHLANIEQELGELKDKVPGPPRAFLNGILQGMGVVLGSILALALLGWLLSFFGLIPGFGQITGYLEGLVDRYE